MAMTTKPLIRTLCRACRHKLLLKPTHTRTFTSTLSQSQEPPNSAASQRASSLFKQLEPSFMTQTPTSDPSPNAPPRKSTAFDYLRSDLPTSKTTQSTPPYHLHLYSHKHNTHLTFTSPTYGPILSLSCGQIGLRHASRGSFDAAYNLSVYFFKKLISSSWRQGGKKQTKNPMLTFADVGNKNSGQPGLEVVLRGYGPGREAFQKALLGQEGELVRRSVWKVTDATRLKFGGTRSPAVRRL